MFVAAFARIRRSWSRVERESAVSWCAPAGGAVRAAFFIQQELPLDDRGVPAYDLGDNKRVTVCRRAGMT